MEIDIQTLRSLPKTDLHCHLDGSVRPSTIREFLRRDEGEVPEDLKERMTVSAGCNSLSEYLDFFALPIRLLQTAQRLTRVARELALDAAEENVWYLEVRFAPFLHLEQNLPLEEVIEAVTEGLGQAEERTRLKTGVILSALRQTDPEKTRRLAQLAVEFKRTGVVGLDLAGAEKDNPAKEHLEAFYMARNENLNLTIHAGEDFGPESIHQAIHYCGAHRIGHGVRLHEDDNLLEYFNDHRIPLEMCLTSNVQTGAVESYEQHPLRRYLETGLRVTLNTDNRTVSDTTVTREFYRAIKHFKLSIDQIRTLVLNGFKSAFMPYEDRSRMIRNVLDKTDEQLYQRDLNVIETE